MPNGVLRPQTRQKSARHVRKVRVASAPEGLGRKGDGIHVSHADACSVKTEINCQERNATVMFPAAKPLFFGGRHDDSINDQTRGGFVRAVPEGEAKDDHWAFGD